MCYSHRCSSLDGNEYYRVLLLKIERSGGKRKENEETDLALEGNWQFSEMILANEDSSRTILRSDLFWSH